MGLYVETRIRAGMDELWERSQDPAQHRRWDLRFTSIGYLPRAEGEPQRFRYATRVLPFLSVDGTGISAGERHRPDGTRVSALRFASEHPLSLLAEGSGYWRYVPDADGIRFLTGYDYRPRWGRFGALADRLVLRPLMGWATAWSFDRLRLWCERGTTPGRALARAIGESALRALLSVAALLYAPLPIALFVLAAALLVPPLPGTPAARRCLRTPPGRTPASAPRLLSTLELS
ncbi:hypothetical protein [Streptomyces virginiae]|uniref:hypothetical protein n=1 Tax=Streptomyces virginiae TaxID=1961 RepID=UPI0005263350|nr:hypothetical protein [Streptomyces virginiae]MCX4716053.1 hypothetical protein [Streptomyces virginiae]MCX5273819.1 hypothetical protein [Streptomyces virginiae]